MAYSDSAQAVRTLVDIILIERAAPAVQRWTSTSREQVGAVDDHPGFGAVGRGHGGHGSVDGGVG